ncbi:MAG: hypothetical protein E7397_04445 [Ruminococcaceae bacterium]|nr:hypothetical protein [Oscillospiraceae bacterium]
MIYKPGIGRMKDDCMIYRNGTYYLFSMYQKPGSDEFRHIWLATSKDGIHFEDYGCVVEDFPELIWAMKVYEADGIYYMNSGSFCENGRQAVLKFWKSEDLLHWEYCPELDVVSPELENEKTRLDCMCVLKHDGKYYGYATGQYGFLISDDGAHWTPNPCNIDYTPFPPYNTALGGFEIADFIELDGTFYLLCGGFGHLGTNGYGVYLYESKHPEGPFTPCLPFYRINGTSKRWVNMWERCFEKDGQLLAHNYMYNGYSYECGDVYLPPIKKLQKTEEKLSLAWWDGNNAMYGGIVKTCDSLISESSSYSVFDDTKNQCDFSELLSIPNATIIEFNMTLSENTFTNYSQGGFFLAETETDGSAVLFDTYGKCEIVHIKDGKIQSVEDVIGFGSTAPYYITSGKTYSVRILAKNGLFELYVNDLYLQTFNNAHMPESLANAFLYFGAASVRNSCTLSNLRIYDMKGDKS